MDRIVAQLLTEIDGLGKRPGMFTIGATNRPDLLDSALLRTGRFDKMIYLGVAKTVEEKVKILEAQTRRLKLASDVDFADIA
jgi:peroxin-6